MFFWLALVLQIFLCSLAVAQDIDDALLSDQYGRKVLFLTSDAIKGLEVAKLEAQKRNIQFDKITRYTLVFEANTIYVSLAPPYRGGLDGPEFRVEIRRSDFKVLSVSNTLGVE